MFKKTKNLKFTGYLIITIILTLGFSISLQSLLAAWTTPTASPPNSNVFPLVYNESITPETKIGISKTELNHNNNDNFYINSYDGLQLRINSDGAGSSNFGVNNSSNTRLLTVTNAGNVGIGTTNPSQKLDVAGSIRSTGNKFLNNTSPTVYFQDSDNRSAMVHINSNKFYVLRGSGNNSTTWSSTGGYWPLVIDLENNNASFGGNIYMKGRDAEELMKCYGQGGSSWYGGTGFTFNQCNSIGLATCQRVFGCTLDAHSGAGNHCRWTCKY